MLHVQSTVTPEIRLLITVARTAGVSNQCLLSQAPEWDTINHERLLTLAERHGMFPLLYQYCTMSMSDVPQNLLALLQVRYLESVRKSLLLTAEMVRLTELLEADGIATVPFKGPALAARAYGNLALRPAGDLDLLIRRSDFVRARKIVIAQGYCPVLELSEEEEEHDYLAKHNDFAFEHPVTKLLLELQWCVVQTPFVFPANMNTWWERLVHGELSGHSMRAFSPEDLLLVLCVHGGKHAWERMLWICDVAALLRSHSDIQWSHILSRAQECHSIRMLRLGLLLAIELCHAPLPEAILAAIRSDKRVTKLSEGVIKRLTQEYSDTGALDNTPLFFLRARESWRERLSILLICYPNVRHPIRFWQHYRLHLDQLHEYARICWRQLPRL